MSNLAILKELTNEQSDKLRNIYYREELFKAFFPFLKDCQNSLFGSTKISATFVWYVAKQSLLNLLQSPEPNLEVLELTDTLNHLFCNIITFHVVHYDSPPEDPRFRSPTIVVLVIMSSMLRYHNDPELVSIADSLMNEALKYDDNIQWPSSQLDMMNKVNTLIDSVKDDPSDGPICDYTQLYLGEEYILNPPPHNQSKEDLYQVLLFDYYDKHVNDIGYPYTAIGMWEKARSIVINITKSDQPNITLLEELTAINNDLLERIHLPKGYYPLTYIEDFKADKPYKIAAYKYDIVDIVELMLTESHVKGFILKTVSRQRENLFIATGKFKKKLHCPLELQQEIQKLHLSGYFYDYTQSPDKILTHYEQEENNDNSNLIDPETFFKIDSTRTLNVCKSKFDEIIKDAKKDRGKQEVLRRITSTTEGFYFNCSQFTHEQLAYVLNQLQDKFTFTRHDIDTIYRAHNKNR